MMLSGCSIERIDYVAPMMVTYEPENVLSSSASLGGEVIGEGGKDVIEYGVVWSTNPQPTINDNKSAAGARLGKFFDTYIGFIPGTTYYTRAYGISSAGAGYGETYEFTTSAEAPCNPPQDNYLRIQNWNDQTVTSVDFSEDNFFDSDANVSFQSHSYGSRTTINILFNEINGRFPLSGEYTVTNEEFRMENRSQGKARLIFNDYGWEQTSASAVPGTKFYVKNENGKITFIFCDTPIGRFTVNGRFSRSNEQ
ncbi:hypothetical protein FNO01nite_28580 [Flavobacterium noncentrifugens]|nr:hypothetical protein FNO01nite_28580 [Flavobacterium noncentrifugens]